MLQYRRVFLERDESAVVLYIQLTTLQVPGRLPRAESLLLPRVEDEDNRRARGSMAHTFARAGGGGRGTTVSRLIIPCRSLRLLSTPGTNECVRGWVGGGGVGGGAGHACGRGSC